MAVQSVIMSMSSSILQFLKPIDGIPVPNGQLLSLVSAAIGGSMLGFRVIKLNKTKSIKYPSDEITFEVIDLSLLRELVYVKLSIVPCVLTPTT